MARGFHWHDSDFERRVELLQGLEFPTLSSKARFSPDGKYLSAIGVYKPQVRLFELSEYTIKHMRGFDGEAVDMAYLGDDYSKMGFVLADRYIEVHASGGRHYKTRIPAPCRCCAFDSHSSHFMIGASSSELYRLSLDEGRFIAPIELPGDACEALTYCPEYSVTYAA
ncbi:hypothetical protein KIPB_012307, partial [Kipferlia bialata]|eukprot:g12307.t1